MGSAARTVPGIGRQMEQGVASAMGETQYLVLFRFFSKIFFRGIIFTHVASLSLRQLNINGNDRQRIWIPLRNPRKISVI
jgi:hypothetical protein